MSEREPWEPRTPLEESDPAERYPDSLLRGLYDEPVERGYEPVHPEGPMRTLLRRLWAPIVAAALLVWKLKFAVLAVFKFKVFTVAGSMLVSIGAYALLWGWKFAVGFVVLLLIHELGHVLEARRQGIKASAPMFIPFLGALIALREMPPNAWREAQIALAGPLVGSAGAAGFWAAGEWLDSDLLVGLAFTGFFLNLFNLLPVVPLDGGRVVAAVHPALWFVGLAGLIGLLLYRPNPILIVIVLFVGIELWQRWQTRGLADDAGYYRLPVWQRVAAGTLYLGLAAVLTLAMGASFIERDI